MHQLSILQMSMITAIIQTRMLGLYSVVLNARMVTLLLTAQVKLSVMQTESGHRIQFVPKVTKSK